MWFRNKNKDLLNVDNYDYVLTGAWFNGLKLKDQLTFLEKWYPIGVCYNFLDNFLVLDDPSSNNDFICEVIGYKLISEHKSEWYILSIRNIGNTISLRNKEYEDFHPGFFKPCISYTRNRKLDELGI